ncbi:hypothetical protein D3C71_1517460 [compost metagenome]
MSQLSTDLIVQTHELFLKRQEATLFYLPLIVGLIDHSDIVTEELYVLVSAFLCRTCGPKQC